MHLHNGEYDPNLSPVLNSAQCLTVALMAAPEMAWPIVRTTLTVQMLPLDLLGKIYDACATLDKAGQSPTVQAILDAIAEPEKEQLIDWRFGVPCLTVERVQDWAQTIRDHYTAQRFGATLAETAISLQTNQITVSEAVSVTQKAIESTTAGGIKTLAAKDYTANYLRYLETPSTSILTGIDTLDTYTGGLIPGDLNTIAGRPGGGKTDFALWIAAYIAGCRNTVLYVSMELSETEISERLFAAQGMINARALRDKSLSDSDKAKLGQTAHKLAQLPLHILDTPAQTAAGIEKAIMQTRPQVVFVDNLDLVRPVQKNTLRNYEIEEICHALKSIAKRNNCCIVALAQAARRNDIIGKPTLADLYGSSAIEHDSSFVLMLSPAANNPENSGSIDGLILKARRGRTGVVPLQADFAYHRWREVG